MTKIIDTAASVASRLPQLKAQGIETCIRYLTTFTASYKMTQPAEAKAIAANGMKLALVFEDYGGTKNYSDIDEQHGVIHANLCLNWCPTLGVPDGTIIWFAVDTDAHGDQITGKIIPYFKAIKARLAGKYRVGIYACGAACQAALDAGAADAAWLSNATGWNGFQAFRASNRWVLLQHLPVKIAGLDVDPDDGQGDYGAFIPWGVAPVKIDPAKRPVLTYGAKGKDVEDLQNLLTAKGFDTHGSDGEFGPLTQAALALYQAKNGLIKITADQATWAKLDG